MAETAVDYDLLNGGLSNLAGAGTRDTDIRKVAVIGAGLVGSLTATILGQRGYHVDLYEYRDDIRKLEHVQGRSINMTIARRGLAALGRIGALDTILQHTIPMYARMIHNLDGSMYPVPYGVGNQCIYSISRVLINQLLLTQADNNPNVNIHFNHKLTQINLKKTEVSFSTQQNRDFSKTYDAVVSADGSFSKTRQQFLRDTSYCYSQTYIDALYVELSILPDENGDSKMPLNYLHIWPRGHFMLIGLPNQDNTWTITLFAPKSVFRVFQTEGGVMGVFEEHFPDTIQLIGRHRILEDCLKSKGYPLVSVKCNPHVLNKTMLIGDAAHAMVPFYGEGMNCGFEDAAVLDTLLAEHGDMNSALARYSERRVEDVQAMCDLAMYNYTEMRDLVRSPFFQLRKRVDNFLHKVAPHFWIPLYTSIRFQDELTYAECMRNKEWQDVVVGRAVVVLGVCVVAVAGFWLKSAVSNLF